MNKEKDQIESMERDLLNDKKERYCTVKGERGRPERTLREL